MLMMKIVSDNGILMEKLVIFGNASGRLDEFN